MYIAYQFTNIYNNNHCFNYLKLTITSSSFSFPFPFLPPQISVVHIMKECALPETAQKELRAAFLLMAALHVCTSARERPEISLLLATWVPRTIHEHFWLEPLPIHQAPCCPGACQGSHSFHLPRGFIFLWILP